MRDCPRLEKLIHILEWARIEDFVPAWPGVGRPPKERGALANGFVAKVVLGLPTTVALIDRLTVDRAPRRIWHKDISTTQIYTHVLNRGGRGAGCGVSRYSPGQRLDAAIR